MNRSLASKRRACELATPVGDDLVHVHVELGPASGHPDVQREHLMVLAGQDLVADLNNESITLIIEPLPGVIGVSRPFLQRGIGGDHFSRDQILSNTKVLE